MRKSTMRWLSIILLACTAAAPKGSPTLKLSPLCALCPARTQESCQPSSTAVRAPRLGLAQQIASKHVQPPCLHAYLCALGAGLCSAAPGANGASPPPPSASDVSLLRVGAVSALFAASPASPQRPVPLPLGPAYNLTTGFAAAWNVSATLALDAAMPLPANETAVGALVRALGTAFYPSSVLFEARPAARLSPASTLQSLVHLETRLASSLEGCKLPNEPAL